MQANLCNYEIYIVLSLTLSEILMCSCTIDRTALTLSLTHLHSMEGYLIKYINNNNNLSAKKLLASVSLNLSSVGLSFHFFCPMCPSILQIHCCDFFLPLSINPSCFCSRCSRVDQINMPLSENYRIISQHTMQHYADSLLPCYSLFSKGFFAIIAIAFADRSIPQ